jgi:pimeloyl-ACP methyl ester carboxylesterase
MASEINVPTKSIRVAHLNGTSIGYQLPKPIVGSKATLFLIPPFGVGAAIFKPQVTDPELLAAMNILVLEPIGQGISKTNAPVYSAWDSAWAFVQVLDALGVKKAFVLGESAGGWIAARMALYVPERVRCLDYHQQRIL